MAKHDIEVTDEAKADLSYYTAFERKVITSELRKQRTHQPQVETKNRKKLRDNPLASWALRVGKFRVFYEIDETAWNRKRCVGRPQRAQCSVDPWQRGAAMRTIDLEKEPLDLRAIINIAQQEPVLLLTADGKEFCLAEADDFEREVESLRTSSAFQRFLDERSASAKRIPLEVIEAEVEQELAEHGKTP